MNKNKDFLSINWMQSDEWVIATIKFNKEMLQIDFDSKFIGDDFDKFAKEFSKNICKLFVSCDCSLKKIHKHLKDDLGYVVKEESIAECEEVNA
jgi:hypothetical protein